MSQQPDLSRELTLWARGYRYIAGVDEAGRGAWAGPVVAAAVILPNDPQALDTLDPVRDSKLLTPAQRDACYELVLGAAVCWGVGAVSSREIDRIGIVPATRRAMQQALRDLLPAPEYLLIDAVPLAAIPLPQNAMPKGDRDCLSIASASIIAKVTRDRWMVDLDRRLPGYGLASHKGYGTGRHQRALRILGPSSQHRHSFAPIRVLDESRDG